MSDRATASPRRGACPLARQIPDVIAALGGSEPDDVPSESACYRFNRKLREHPDLMDAFDAAIVAALVEADPRIIEFGAMDATDVPARSNQQKYEYRGGPERTEYSDPDANWWHHSAKSCHGAGGFSGFKEHVLVSAHPDTEVPEVVLAHSTYPAKTNEQIPAPGLINVAVAREALPTIVIADSQYDGQPLATKLENHRSIPIVFRIPRKVPGSSEASDPDFRRTCSHGTWRYAGTDYNRRATKWRCPAGECRPKSVREPVSRRSPLIPYKSTRWRQMYKQRTAVERVYSRLKEHHLLSLNRVRRLDRVSQHCAYSIWTYNLWVLYRMTRAG